MLLVKVACCAVALTVMAGPAPLSAAPVVPVGAGWAQQVQAAAAPGAIVRSIGTIQAIQGSVLTLKTDRGSDISVQVQDQARLVRVEPGQKTLKGATPIGLQDLQVGDRILVAGKAAPNPGVVLASSVIVMKRTDIEREQRQEEEEWQKRGVGGLVRSVDPATGTAIITTRVKGLDKTITIHTSKDTILRRYAPGSVSFQAAKPGTFDQIKPGDQLRARGALSADGSSLAAAEIVSGTFRNIAGTVISVDPSMNEVTVMDLITKQPVAVKVTAQSELRKLPEAAARMIALRLKPGGAASSGSGYGGEYKLTSSNGAAAMPHPVRPAQPGQGSGPPDLDQVLRRVPTITLGDLRKGDAVMIVSTEGATSGAVTAIKLVSGVEPILTAAPTGRQREMLQSLWSGFSTSGGGGGGEAAEGGTPSPATH